jgi:hypothetical protein
VARRRIKPEMMIAGTVGAINTQYGLEFEREGRTTMDGKRFSRCTTNTSNNGRGGGSRGWRWYRIIRCLLALEGALGRVGTPPAAVAALRRGVVDAGLVIPVGVGDDRGGRGGRDDGGWRHLWLLVRSGSQVTLGVGWVGVEGMEEEDSLLLYPRGSPPQPVHPSNQIRTITCHRSPAVPSSS